MRLFRKVAIIGIGLIGGSIALAIKRKGLAQRVIGVSRHKKTLSFAKKMKAIDIGSVNLRVAEDADLIILATPVGTILNLAGQIAHIAKKDCIVTDVGSTKGVIVDKLTRVFHRYVGTHPLAGSEKRGIRNADSGIFGGSLCIVTPTSNTDQQALRKLERLWHELGAKTVRLSPQVHDKALSCVSHLPHAVAFSLIGVIPQNYLKFSASGLRDTTRIAASDTLLWRDIFLSNRKNVLRAIDLFTRHLEKLKDAIKNKDRKLLGDILKAAKIKREKLG